MRITLSESAANHSDLCPLYECNRHYCNAHRLLWRDCDTMRQTSDGAGQTYYEIYDGPCCEEEARHAKVSPLRKIA